MDGKSWAIELWDRVEDLLKHASDQNESVEAGWRLLSEVQKLQSDFGRKLKKVVNEYQAKKKLTGDKLTLNTSISEVIQQLWEMGNVHEQCAKEIGDQVVNSLKTITETDKKDIEKQKSEWVKLNINIDQLRKNIETAWKNYVLAFKEKQKADENRIKANNDMTMARVDQQKFEAIYNSKAQLFDQSKTDYAVDLNKYNNDHRRHYTRKLVELIDQLEMADQDRGTKVRDLLTQSGQLHEEAVRKINECCRLTKEIAARTDTIQDAATIVKRLCTDEFHPVDLPFLDLDRCPLSVLDGPPAGLANFILGLPPSHELPVGQRSLSIINQSSMGSMLSNLKRPNHARAAKDESKTLRTPFVCGIGITPVKCQEMTIRQIADRVSELKQQVEQTDKELQGTKCLLEACKSNPKLGDVSLVQPKSAVLIRRLSSINQRISRLEEQYTRMGGDNALSAAQSMAEQIGSQYVNDHSSGPNRIKSGVAMADAFDSDNSFDSDADDSNRGESENTPTPALGLLRERRNPMVRPSNSDYIGYATVKYDYEGNGPDYLAAKSGELFYILEVDSENSGWTTVVAADNARKGFLPTAYIDVTFY